MFLSTYFCLPELRFCLILSNTFSADLLAIAFNKSLPLIAMSASSSNMTSLSSKRVEELAKDYKSENTKDLILKGYVIYWLYQGQYKKKAADIEAEEETDDTPPDPENPIPTPIPTVTPLTTTLSPSDSENDAVEGKTTYFKAMYAPEQNYTTKFNIGSVSKKRYLTFSSISYHLG